MLVILDRDISKQKNYFSIQEHKDFIEKLEDLIPRRKITKFGKNFRIAPVNPDDNKAKICVETFDTLSDDIFNIGNQMEEEEMARKETGFQKSIRRFLIRNRMSLETFISLLAKKQLLSTDTRIMDKAIFEIINRTKPYSRTQEISNFLHTFCKIKNI